MVHNVLCVIGLVFLAFGVFVFFSAVLGLLAIEPVWTFIQSIL